jgi:hypothetical protein
MKYSELIIEREIVENEIKVVKEQMSYFSSWTTSLVAESTLEKLKILLEILEEKRKELY